MFLLADGTARCLGALRQHYRDCSSDFYFFPSHTLDTTKDRNVDHLSFHFSGQSHVSFTDTSKDLITDKTLALAQPDVGCAPFFSARFDGMRLPICNEIKDGDVTLDARRHPGYLWFDLVFVSSLFLLNNNLGFGTIVTDVALAPSMIGRKVFAAGHLPHTQYLCMQFIYGNLGTLTRPQSIELRTYGGQRRHADRL